MRRVALVFMLALALGAALAPLGEAACPGEDCAGDDVFGGCAVDLCCSCCLHVRVDPPHASSLRPDEAGGSSLGDASALRLVHSDPREILHVPRASRSV
jgi:hypothetical protein